MADPDNSYDLQPPAASNPGVARPKRAAMQLTDRLCAKCGYNLRGLPKGRQCPECGAKNSPSRAFNDELQYGNPRWSGRLALGMGIFFLASLGFPVQMFMRYEGVNWNEQSGLSLGLYVMEMVGLWLLTTPEPGKLARENRWTVRRLVRYTAVLALLVAAVWEASRRMENGVAMEIILWWASILLLVGRTAALGYFLRAMAQRIPDDQLSNQVLVVTWAICGTILAVVLTGGLCGIGGLFSLAIFYPWAIYLLWQFARDLWASAKEARKGMIVAPGEERG